LKVKGQKTGGRSKGTPNKSTLEKVETNWAVTEEISRQVEAGVTAGLTEGTRLAIALCEAHLQAHTQITTYWQRQAYKFTKNGVRLRNKDAIEQYERNLALFLKGAGLVAPYQSRKADQPPSATEMAGIPSSLPVSVPPPDPATKQFDAEPERTGPITPQEGMDEYMRTVVFWKKPVAS
jgi:hypothetical protein